MNGLLTIVPVASKPGYPTPASGTKVIGPDGTPIRGIRRVELIAEVNDVWRARIDCHVTVPKIENVLADLPSGKPMNWWRRVLLRLAGVRGVDVVAMASVSLGR